jgi:hypothetical protein
VLPVTHTMQRLDGAALAELASAAQPQACLAARGDILAMSLLLVHRSLRATRPGHRRVVHLEYTAQIAAIPLPRSLG